MFTTLKIFPRSINCLGAVCLEKNFQWKYWHLQFGNFKTSLKIFLSSYCWMRMTQKVKNICGSFMGIKSRCSLWVSGVKSKLATFLDHLSVPRRKEWCLQSLHCLQRGVELWLKTSLGLPMYFLRLVFFWDTYFRANSLTMQHFTDKAGKQTWIAQNWVKISYKELHVIKKKTYG